MEYISTQKFIVTSPRKLREVVAMIKKLKPMDAVERLPFTNKRAADPLLKVVKSAIANAKQKNVNPEDLVFSEIQIGEGPRLKRFRAGSRGRAKPYKRRMSHIRVVLKVVEAVKSQVKVEKTEVVKNGDNVKSENKVKKIKNKK
ncbi:MAG: 50S ribosomal protein L22 [Candidatus Woesebacteria bacterium GW2011_GWA1_37_8]|uniref:Large ribosomal subunit protein uL22 n=2 Tax=Candidatus Woeseibacteriota TaxID=1752722 RepID=A0A0G0L9P1_9BACT|nr:MAG: 50S ribosomal protein L22 [Microgenomates group bacterium GW2011_GWC1_37_12b]KKQ45880.1 MAG: 50S ribosomal protein L22 [Candidatus Woesebacteria bacterium GW2011_GWA1_37_8]KKQ87712.1 MAG: 50S ribosomal protein L22 [Candidatus Woesebacteria bacterium GW2011_GWB1_38_8b]